MDDSQAGIWDRQATVVQLRVANLRLITPSLYSIFATRFSLPPNRSQRDQVEGLLIDWIHSLGSLVLLQLHQSSLITIQ